MEKSFFNRLQRGVLSSTCLFAVALLVLVGCRASAPQDETPEERAYREARIAERRDNAAAEEAKRKQANAEEKAKPTGISAELNDVERSYLDAIHSQNDRDDAANARKVFGGGKF